MAGLPMRYRIHPLLLLQQRLQHYYIYQMQLRLRVLLRRLSILSVCIGKVFLQRQEEYHRQGHQLR